MMRGSGTRWRVCLVGASVLTVILTLVALPAAAPASAQSSGELSYSSCHDLLALVDKQHRLPSYYTPPDLTYLSYYGVPTVGSQLLRQGAAAELSRMVAAANLAGVELAVTSAYRSYWTQQSLYSYWTGVYGPGAGGVSAPPGASQHQLGTTVDFTNAYAGYGLNYSFGYSDAYYWLLRNARYYGFVLSYPPGARWQTGYYWEPWHWRYVGVRNAINIVNSDLGVQGYLERYGTLPYC